jgi:hypothetical protein
MRKYFGLLAATGLATLPALSLAAAPTLSDVLGASGITATGHLSGSYTTGFNKGQALAYRAFDGTTDSFTFNQAMLNLSKTSDSGVGGAVSFLVGNDASGVNAAYGDSSGNFNLMQGYLSYTSGNFSVMGGRYVTLAGAEVIDDSADTNISRSLLFQLAEPLVHTGVRTSYKMGDATFYLGVNNGIYTGNANDTNKQKALETGFAYAFSPAVSLGVYDYYSHEGGAGLNYLDSVLSWTATDKLSFVLNGDWASAHYSDGTPGTYLYGLAGYMNYAFTDQWKASLRGEYLKTKNATITGDSNGKSDLSEVTATIGYSPLAGLTLLGEVRYDMSGDKNFPDPGTDTPPTFSDNQGDIAVKAIYAF